MNLLHASQITVRIANRTLCKPLDLEIQPGDYWAILGPNGCGKSTLLHTLASLRSNIEGQIFVKNQPITRLSQQVLAENIGLLFQKLSPVFFHTVYEFCSTGRYPHLAMLGRPNTNDHTQIMQALATMGLQEYSLRQTDSLSGGEQQRLAIATLLAQAPQLYLLDEPTNHLDINHQIAVLKHFEQLTLDGYAVMMTTHDINVAQRYCNKFLLIFENGDTYQGTAKESLTQTNLQRLYNHPLHRIDYQEQTVWLPIS